jgi:hypothetical protein
MYGWLGIIGQRGDRHWLQEHRCRLTADFVTGTASSMSRRLSEHPLHLGLDASATSEPRFTGEMDWYEAYGARHAGDGKEGRLVSMHSFDASWDSWEMHPEGSEVVLCTEGEMTLVQQIDGKEARTRLTAGEYAINGPGIWHTADVPKRATAIFITAGLGTQHRKR